MSFSEKHTKEIEDKGLSIQKMSADKSQMPKNLFAQIVCPSPKVWYFNEKRSLHWASVVSVPRLLDQTRIS